MCCVPPFFLCFLSLLWLLRGDSLGWHTIFTRDTYTIYTISICICWYLFVLFVIYGHNIFNNFYKIFCCFLLRQSKIIAIFCVVLHGNNGARGARGTNRCTNICIYFGILFNNFSLCPFSKYTNTRRGAQTHTRTHSQTQTLTQTEVFFAPMYNARGEAGVCAVSLLYISFAFSRCLARSLCSVESNRIELSDNVVLSGATQTTQWARSGLEKSSRVRRRWKTQTCCLGRTISHHQIVSVCAARVQERKCRREQ